MRDRERPLEPSLARAYLRDNFMPEDRLAVVVVNRRSNTVCQRISALEQLIAPDFQAWLKEENRRQGEIYVSMNALNPQARGRTKSDIGAIRHIYLDLDENGTRVLDTLLKRPELPPPNWVVGSSPDKWQVSWKVEGFEKVQAEAFQKALARETGADPAATDCARVMRIPGFYNHKYAEPYYVSGERLTGKTCRPEHFPPITVTARDSDCVKIPAPPHQSRLRSERVVSQSERDWAYARRALARGESPGNVAASIASFRRYDKYDPRYYARLTVEKAGASLKAHPSPGPDRS